MPNRRFRTLAGDSRRGAVATARRTGAIEAIQLPTYRPERRERKPVRPALRHAGRHECESANRKARQAYVLSTDTAILARRFLDADGNCCLMEQFVRAPTTGPCNRYFTFEIVSMPYFEPTRLSSDLLTPPNGATVVDINPVLIPAMPCSGASATRHNRPRARA
jgi:hypothetical protein